MRAVEHVGVQTGKCSVMSTTSRTTSTSQNQIVKFNRSRQRGGGGSSSEANHGGECFRRNQTIHPPMISPAVVMTTIQRTASTEFNEWADQVDGVDGELDPTRTSPCWLELPLRSRTMPQSTPSAQPRPLPGPAVVAASSAHPDVPPTTTTTPNSRSPSTWIHPHKLPHRRFIGPLPESVINSPEVEETRRWYEDLRRTLLRQDGLKRQGAPDRKERKQGGWVDVDGTRNPVKKVARVGKGVVDHVRGSSHDPQHHHYHPHLNHIGRTSTDAQSVSAESYMTDDTTPTNPSASTSHPHSTRWIPWRSSSRTSKPSRRPNVFTGESFTIGQPFLDSFVLPEAGNGVDAGRPGMPRGRMSRCEKKYGGLIDVDDEYISTSSSSSSTASEGEEKENDRLTQSQGGKTIYGSPTSMSIHLDPDLNDQADPPGPSRPSLRSRGTEGTGTQSFQTARSYQPSSSLGGMTLGSGSGGSFRTARTHQPGGGALGSKSRGTSYQTTMNEDLMEDYQSAYSTLPPTQPRSGSTATTIPPTTFLDQNRAWERTGSSSTAGAGTNTTTTMTHTNPFGSTSSELLLPPATGVTYDTSRLSDSSGYHLGVPPVQPAAEVPGGGGEGEQQHGSLSLPLPRSTRLSGGGKLKSALKFRSNSQTKGGVVVGQGEEGDGLESRKRGPLAQQGQGSTARGKTVQFPIGEGLDDRGSGMGDPTSLRSRFRGLRKRLKEDSLDDDDQEREGDYQAHEEDDHSLEPADPRQVLARTGSEVVGTSAGVVEAHQKDVRTQPILAGGPPRLKPSKTPGQQAGASKPGVSNAELGLDPAGHTEDDAGPDAVVLRDRMLLRVGRNRDRSLVDFDEAMLRRKPCSRLERMEGGSNGLSSMRSHFELTRGSDVDSPSCSAAEYLVVYRKGRIELYQEWVRRSTLAHFRCLNADRSLTSTANPAQGTLRSHQALVLYNPLTPQVYQLFPLLPHRLVLCSLPRFGAFP